MMDTCVHIHKAYTSVNPCFFSYAAFPHLSTMLITPMGYGSIFVRFEEYIVCIPCLIVGGIIWLSAPPAAH